MLRKDPQQDYHLEYAMENETHTILAFSRELHTCDTNDRSITVRGSACVWGDGAINMGRKLVTETSP